MDAISHCDFASRRLSIGEFAAGRLKVFPPIAASALIRDLSGPGQPAAEPPDLINVEFLSRSVDFWLFLA
jgi:hypothetical protein